MKKTKNYIFNLALTQEKRLVYAQKNLPRSGEMPASIPSVKDAEKGMHLETEITRTQEKLKTLEEQLNKLSLPKAKVSDINEKLLKINKKLEEIERGKEKKTEELTFKTLDKINTTIDSTVGKYRIGIMRKVLEKSKDDIMQGNLSSLVTVFTLLKSDDVPVKIKVKNEDLAIHRRGHNLIVEQGTGDDKVEAVYTLKVENGHWQMMSGNEPLPASPPKIERSADPLAGMDEGEDKFNPKKAYLRKREVSIIPPNADINKMIENEMAKASKSAELKKKELPIHFKDLHDNYQNKKLSKDMPIVKHLETLKPTDQPVKYVSSVTYGNETRRQTTYISSTEKNNQHYYRISIQQDHPDGVKTHTTHFYPQDARGIDFKGADPVYEKWAEAGTDGKTKETPDQLEQKNINATNELVEAIILSPEANVDNILEDRPNIKNFPKEFYSVYNITPPFRSPVYKDKAANQFFIDFTADTFTIYTIAPGEYSFHKTYEKKGTEPMKKFDRPETQTAEEFLRAEGIIPPKTSENVKSWAKNVEIAVDELVKKFQNRDELKKIQNKLLETRDMQGKSNAEKRRIYEETAKIAVGFKQRLEEAQKSLKEKTPNYDKIKKELKQALIALPNEEIQKEYAFLMTEPAKPDKAMIATAPAKPSEKQETAKTAKEWLKDFDQQITKLIKLVESNPFKQSYLKEKEGDPKEKKKTLATIKKDLENLHKEITSSGEKDYTDLRRKLSKIRSKIPTKTRLPYLHTVLSIPKSPMAEKPTPKEAAEVEEAFKNAGLTGNG